MIIVSCTQHEDATFWTFPNSLLDELPPQPGEKSWYFVEDLKEPMWKTQPWGFTHSGSDQADLSGGVNLDADFDDPQGRLETAYSDLRRFVAAGGVPTDSGAYLIKTVKDQRLGEEAFRLEIGSRVCRIIAGDIEGIRRGIYYLEDVMRSLRGPYLPLRTIERRPFIKRRISRGFYSPIKRPPKMRDELIDTVNYYPDEYLSRLAHNGINGLWLSVSFRDLVSTKFTPEYGKEAERRLAKLRRTVDRLLDYGIKTYIFTIEPRAWDADSPVLENYPELAGARRGNGQYYFCPSSETARQYLYESVNSIFKSVPELGGIINISHGERATTCLSAVAATSSFNGHIKCPRCSGKEPWEILYNSLSAMERGMHDAAPNAELISWLYMPQSQDLADWVYKIPAHTPRGVILQFNYESGVHRNVFGKDLVGGDYWLSPPGPSARFARLAKIARKHGTEMSAKIQTSNSHEVATVPIVPIPSMIYQKFTGMRHLKVSHSMLCWYFGNYPGMMNKAAGLLSFEPFPKNENIFLHRLASIYWKKEDVSAVVEAWNQFSKGYANYPLNITFQRYGPMHDGPVWPLLLKPADAPLSPTWQLGGYANNRWPPSGDRIGECIPEPLTLSETLELCRRMSSAWNRGVAILDRLRSHNSNEPERLLDIGLAKALGIQFQSGYDILKFYLLREKMYRMEGIERLQILKSLKQIINTELDLDEQLLKLCKQDSRLGFHSEAEGYKYFPDKIRWRMHQLRNLLEQDVPELSQQIRNNQPFFPTYTGQEPTGATAYAVVTDSSLWQSTKWEPPSNLHWQPCTHGSGKLDIKWAASYDDDALYILVSADVAPPSERSSISNVLVKVEPRRLWPSYHFNFNPTSEKWIKRNQDFVASESVKGRIINKSDRCYAILRIPFERIWWNGEEMHPIRIDVRVRNGVEETSAWRSLNPTVPRLNLGEDNPVDLGWLLFGARM